MSSLKCTRRQRFSYMFLAFIRGATTDLPQVRDSSGKRLEGQGSEGSSLGSQVQFLSNLHCQKAMCCLVCFASNLIICVINFNIFQLICLRDFTTKVLSITNSWTVGMPCQIRQLLKPESVLPLVDSFLQVAPKPGTSRFM